MSPGDDAAPGRNQGPAVEPNTITYDQRTAHLRRREAAQRCEPLADGRRDPDDERDPRKPRGQVCFGCSALSWAERDRLVDCSSICLLAVRSA
jgi:hypothetical protein